MLTGHIDADRTQVCCSPVPLETSELGPLVYTLYYLSQQAEQCFVVFFLACRMSSHSFPVIAGMKSPNTVSACPRDRTSRVSSLESENTHILEWDIKGSTSSSW